MPQNPSRDESNRRIEELEEAPGRKGPEKTLQASNELFEKTFMSQMDAILILDHGIPPRIVDCNPAAERIFGYSRDAMLDKTTEFLHVNQAALHDFQKRLYPKVSEQGFFHLDGFVMKRRDGTVFTTEHTVVPLNNEKGDRTGWVSVVRDISDRKQMEEALRESEERYRSLAENVSDVIYKLDLKSEQYTYASPSVKNLLGYTSVEAPRLRVKDVMTAESYERQTFKMQEALANGNKDSAVLELEAVHKDGRIVPVEIHASFIFDKQGNPVEVQGVARDITDRKRGEDALRKAQEDLEHRVEERTLDLSKAKQELEAQRNRLEEVNIALKVLLEKRVEEKAEVEMNISVNIKQLILPYLEKLKKAGLNDRQATITEILESNLDEVVSPFSRRLSSNDLGFTPFEIKVAALIKQGKTSKEMADVFDVSPRTIEAHRENIRKKIGIKCKKDNLRTRLLSME